MKIFGRAHPTWFPKIYFKVPIDPFTVEHKWVLHGGMLPAPTRDAAQANVVIEAVNTNAIASIITYSAIALYEFISREPPLRITFTPRLVDNKALQEIGPELLFSLHVDPQVMPVLAQHDYLPHMTYSRTRYVSVTANIRGGTLTKAATLLCARYSIDASMDKMKAGSRAGSAHPLARYIQDTL